MIQTWRLAALLFFTSHILLWSNPAEWPLAAVASFALAALVLDWLARYHVRELFGLLLLAGAYGALAGLLFAPPDLQLPHQVVTLALGAYTLAACAAFVLLRPARWLMIGLGLAWGVWVRWGPNSLDLLPMLLAGALALIVIGVLFRWTQNAAPRRLTPPEWVLLAVVLAALLLLRGVDPLRLAITAALVGYCWLILWFQRSERPRTLLDGWHPLSVRDLLLAGGLLLAAGALGYSLPFDGQPREIIGAVFTAFGMVWLPTVSLVLGVRTYRRATRQKQL